MSNLLKLTVVGAALLASASIASAQDHKSAAQSARASQAMQSGPYVYAPPKKVEPAQPARPFTWEEKRFFEMSIGEEG